MTQDLVALAEREQGLREQGLRTRKSQNGSKQTMGYWETISFSVTCVPGSVNTDQLISGQFLPDSLSTPPLLRTALQGRSFGGR
jgi:hypothetical protein